MDRDEIASTDPADPSAPSHRCFGCSPHNERGLRMRFERVGPGVVESRFVAEPHLCGSRDVVHGGIQAALLDEVIGKAIHDGLGADDGPIVTVDFQLRYRRPAPMGEPLLVRGTLVRRDGAYAFATGEILDAEGAVCTESEARWKRIEGRTRG